MRTEARHARLGTCAALVAGMLVCAAGTDPGYRGGTGFFGISAAVAEEGGHSSDHAGGRGGGGQGGGYSAGGEHGDGHGAGHSPGAKGRGGQDAGRGGHGHEAARGGGKAVEDKVLSGGRPAWAREGIPEIELGRLNVARAPDQVLARAEGEALSTYDPTMRDIYSLDAEQAAALLTSRFRDLVRYDSPVQNLALYRNLMTFGDTRLRDVDPQLTPSSQLDLAAIFLGSASDKTIPISEDTVMAVNRILGLAEMDPADRATLAGKAEAVRQAILAGHGAEETH